MLLWQKSVRPHRAWRSLHRLLGQHRWSALWTMSRRLLPCFHWRRLLCLPVSSTRYIAWNRSLRPSAWNCFEKMNLKATAMPSWIIINYFHFNVSYINWLLHLIKKNSYFLQRDHFNFFLTIGCSPISNVSLNAVKWSLVAFTGITALHSLLCCLISSTRSRQWMVSWSRGKSKSTRFSTICFCFVLFNQVKCAANH